MMCAIALACGSLVGSATAKAQGTDQDKQFVMTAAQSDYNEIHLSQLAVQKATDPKVKAFAQKMVTDHTTLEQEMKPFAQQLGVTPPTSFDSQHQQIYDQLNQLSGKDFDKQYMSAMDTDHHTALTLFQTELSSTQNTAMKPTLKKGEKVVAEHTKMADKLSGQLGGSTSGM